jgi:hypothetical protein
MTTQKLIRAYKYRAFAPDDMTEFDRALVLKRALWKRLIEIEDEYDSRKAALLNREAFAQARAAAESIKDAGRRKAALAATRDEYRRRAEAAKPELLALGSWRVAAQREAKQQAAAAGLHWGDYNAVVFQFEGARAAAKARGAQVYNFEQACGEAIVNQIMNGRSPAQLCAFSQCRLSFKADPKAARRKKGSHRSGYRLASIDMTLRGPRNPAGPARLVLDFVMHRPLPPDAIVKEVRAIRVWRRIVNKDGCCFSRTEWSVVFVCELRVAARPDRTCCGLSLTWRASDAEDGLQPYGLLFDGSATKTLTMDYGYEADWAHRAELFARAEASGDDADRASAEAFDRRLQRRRMLSQREAAARIARRYAVVAVQKIDLSQKGAKHHTAPASFRLALRHALENHGGTLIETSAPLDRSARDPHSAQAKVLYAAARAFFSQTKERNCVMPREVAA